MAPFPEDITMDALRAEVRRDRTERPGNLHLFVALTKELGELARVMLQRLPHSARADRALRVAAIAIRLLEERDSAFDDDAKDLP